MEHSNRITIMVVRIAILLLIIGLIPPSYAILDSKSVAIQRLLDDAARTSGVPGMSASIFYEDETLHFSSGVCRYC